MKIIDFDETKLKNPNHPKIKDLIDNEEPYIAELKAMSDKVLAQKLSTVRIQKQWAVEQEKWIEYDVLRMFEDMIITARILRAEENPDSREYNQPITRPKKEKKIKTEERHSNAKLPIKEFSGADEISEHEDNQPEQLRLFNFETDN